MKDFINEEDDNFKIFQWALFWTFLFIIIILLILFGIFFGIYKILTPQVIILDNEGNEINSLYACCTNITSVNYFENSSGENYIIGKTLINKSENYGEICLPKEEIKYMEFPCFDIDKKEIDIEWLEMNAKCLECYFKEDNSMKLNGCNATYDFCFKYKFGNYIIEIK